MRSIGTSLPRNRPNRHRRRRRANLDVNRMQDRDIRGSADGHIFFCTDNGGSSQIASGRTLGSPTLSALVAGARQRWRARGSGLPDTGFAGEVVRCRVFDIQRASSDQLPSYRQSPAIRQSGRRLAPHDTGDTLQPHEQSHHHCLPKQKHRLQFAPPSESRIAKPDLHFKHAIPGK